MIPSFAVVGHPNKGKSSIVATLAEDDRIAIGREPGTTRRAHGYTFSIDGEPQYVLIDTPGFQRAGAVLDWLTERADGAHQRPELVARFVADHASDPRFHDECELLKPIVEGAGILYVVDGAKPYGPEYEIEMQVLQWTGRPRMALINLIGSGDYLESWQHALNQYFSIVRVFDAVRADFSKRIALLRAFAELDEDWRPGIERAVTALVADRERRRQRSAAAIADALVEALMHQERAPLAEDADAGTAHRDRLTARLQERLRERIRRIERQARDQVQSLYRHPRLDREDGAAELLESDLFTAEGWELFGLSRRQLLVSGMLSGAVAGGGVDVLLGGASLLLGAGVGALLGGAGAWFGGDELARIKVLGQPLGGSMLQVGPVRSPNFPWILLGRAWTHHRLVAERNHARREALSAALAQAMAEQQNLMDAIPDALRRELGQVFRQLLKGEVTPELRTRLQGLTGQLLALDLAAGPAGND